MLGGAGAPSTESAPQTGGGGLGDLLGILGGAGAAQAPQSTGGSGLLGGPLGGLLGGASTQQASPFPGGSALTSGLASALADKLGVSPVVASTIISFALTLLMQSLQKRTVQRQAPGEGTALPAEALAAPELGDLLKTLGGRSPAAAARLVPSGAAESLAAQTGMDVDTAEQSLTEAFKLLGGQFGSGVTS